MISTPTKKLIVKIVVLALLYGAWKFNTFWGYYQFKQLCAAEGGLRVNQKLRRNVGWEGPSVGEAQSYSTKMPYVKFFRATRGPYGPPANIEKGQLLDLRYIGGSTLAESSYEFKIADLAIPTVYRISNDVIKDPSDKRISRFTFVVKEAAINKVMVTYTELHYSWRHPDRGMLEWFGPAGFVGCPLNIDSGLKNYEDINQNAFMPS